MIMIMDEHAIELEKCRQAIAAIKLTLQEKPNLLIARYDLGMLYLKVGDRGAAIQQFRQLKKYDGTIAQRLLEKIFPERKDLPTGQ
jgi:hypothetical protein